MARFNPFSQAGLNEIFRLSPSRPDCVHSRESSCLEFKKSFNWGSAAKYARTLAAFANTKGGFIVFGIDNRPHRLVGLKDDTFESIDPEKVSGFFAEHFAPEIVWDIVVHEVAGKHFGLLYVHESPEKPVVCIKEVGTDLREGDIYYRYRGRTTRIKYPELRTILDQRRREEERLWLKHLARVARIGVRDAGIFDLQTGVVAGAKGAFVIDESLLSQLSFIREGEFSETRGKPTLKLVGDVEVVGKALPGVGRKEVIKTRGIRVADIVIAFLDLQKVPEPVEYVRQICFETTAFLPVYYFMRLANMGPKDAIDLLDGVVSRCQAKTKLIGRLHSETTQQTRIPPSETASANRKRRFVEQVLKKQLSSNLTGDDLKYGLQAVRSLDPGQVRNLSKYLRPLLKTMFNKHYASGEGALVDELRRAICWLDEALYMEAR